MISGLHDCHKRALRRKVSFHQCLLVDYYFFWKLDISVKFWRFTSLLYKDAVICEENILLRTLRI